MTLVNCENYTKGLVNQIDKDKNKKMFFFEIDSHDIKLVDLILEVYEKYELTVVYHKTKMGYHFISPTLLNLTMWKMIHKELIDINPTCPMITLRVEGNKYPNELNYFYKAGVKINCHQEKNVKSICLFLNKVFDFEPKLGGLIEGDLQLVSYLPKRNK